MSNMPGVRMFCWYWRWLSMSRSLKSIATAKLLNDVEMGCFCGRSNDRFCPKYRNRFDVDEEGIETFELLENIFISTGVLSSIGSWGCWLFLVLWLINDVRMIRIIIATKVPEAMATRRISVWDFPSIDTFGTEKRWAI